MATAEDASAAEVLVGAEVLEDFILPELVHPPGLIQALTRIPAHAPDLPLAHIPVPQGDGAAVQLQYF